MQRFARALERETRRLLASADATLNRLYGWRGNPLYQSGALAISLLILLIVTGVYLLIFYRVGSPYASVARLNEQVWVGRWIRALHRYASDAAVLAVLAHGFRMYAQRRRWGPRALAWVSGLVLLGLLLVCGWTGYVMVWDTFGQVLAVEGARLLDLLPLFSEPIGRAFVGEQPIPGAFFFLNLFLHIALPIGFGVVLWVHVSRVARPVLAPPRRVTGVVVGLLVLAAVLIPVVMAPEASPFVLPERVPLDVFYALWLPLTRELPAGVVWLLGAAALLLLAGAPIWSRPALAERPRPSLVNERLCTGCWQCALDCPYEAIAMLPRTDGRAEVVARVDPSRCVSCGICAGSCAPMGVGPPQRTGRDQLERVQTFLAQRQPEPGGVVIVACSNGAGGLGDDPAVEGLVFPVQCAGNVHTSVIEYLVRAGVEGVLLVACPARDCWNREGAAWLEARVFRNREAELQERVDRRRVRVAYAGRGERRAALEAVREFRTALLGLESPVAEEGIDVLKLCDATESVEGAEA